MINIFKILKIKTISPSLLPFILPRPTAPEMKLCMKGRPRNTSAQNGPPFPRDIPL